MTPGRPGIWTSKEAEALRLTQISRRSLPEPLRPPVGCSEPVAQDSEPKSQPAPAGTQRTETPPQFVLHRTCGLRSKIRTRDGQVARTQGPRGAH